MIDPRFLTASEWAAQTTPLIAQFGAIPQLHDEAHWRDWAGAVASLPALASVAVARPEGFGTWQDWAYRFNESAVLLAA